MDFSQHTDQQLKKDVFQILALATIPMENWFPVFSNPVIQLPGLRCKTFCIWFPTMIDVLAEENGIIKKLYDEIAKRHIVVGKTQSFTFSLIDLFKKVLAHFSKEEQLFLYNRRLQNAHGFLSMYFRTVQVKWFDPMQNKVIVEKFSPDDYEKMLLHLNQDMHNQSQLLLNKFVTKNNNSDGYNLMKFYADNLQSPKLEELGKTIGVVN